MSDKVKQTAVEEVDRVRVLATQAVKSGAYFYPFTVYPSARSETSFSNIS
jgi:hypothetical protein